MKAYKNKWSTIYKTLKKKKESACQCRRHRRCGFGPWVGKMPWRRNWQPTPVFLPGKFQEQSSLMGYSPWGCRESDTTEGLNALTHHLRWIVLSWFFLFFGFFPCSQGCKNVDNNATSSGGKKEVMRELTFSECLWYARFHTHHLICPPLRCGDIITTSELKTPQSRHLAMVRLETQTLHTVLAFPSDSVGKGSACNVGYTGSIPGSGRSPLETGMATHTSVLAWRIPWTEEPGGPQSMGSQRLGLDWVTNFHTLRTTLCCLGKIKHLIQGLSSFVCINLYMSIGIS